MIFHYHKKHHHHHHCEAKHQMIIWKCKEMSLGSSSSSSRTGIRWRRRCQSRPKTIAPSPSFSPQCTGVLVYQCTSVKGRAGLSETGSSRITRTEFLCFIQTHQIQSTSLHKDFMLLIPRYIFKLSWPQLTPRQYLVVCTF